MNEYLLSLYYLPALGAEDTLVKKIEQVEGRVVFLKEELDKYRYSWSCDRGLCVEAHRRGTQLI